AVGHRADERTLVHHPRELRQMLADLQPRHIRGNGLELPANFRRGIHLQVEDVLVRRSARQEHHDHRLVRFASALLRLRSEQFRQGQAAHGKAADPPSTGYCGLPARSLSVVFAVSIPRNLYRVAKTSPKCTARSVGSPPSLSVAPITWPRLKPPPASSALPTRGQ